MSQDNGHSVSRRAFLRGAAGTAAAATIPSSGAAVHLPAARSTKRPLNVLFLMSDDMRVELASYGSRFNVHSPNIDRLGSQGIRFDRNYCQFPLCNPSRSSLLTGRVPLETRVLDNRTGVRDLHPDWTTLPQLFREHGYTTFRGGKIFHGGLDDHKAWTDFYGETESLHPTAEGTRMNIPREAIPRPDGVVPPFPHDERALHSDEILVLQGNGEGAGDYLVADLAIQYLRRCRNEPFFIACGFSKPHSPPTAPQRFFDLYDPARIQLPPDFAAWPTVPPGFPAAAIRPRNADLFIGRGASESEAKQVIRAYLASISWADWNLGRVMAELDQLGLRDKTLVVFVADHGYQLGEKGKWSKAGSLFEQGTRVPLIIHAPDAQGNGRPCLRVVQSLDLYRTIAGLCGLDVPVATEGTNISVLLSDPQVAWDQPACSIWSEDGTTVHGTAIRTEQWRYAEFGKNAANGAMLFDVHADPLELQNLANNPVHADVVHALSKQVNAYSYSTG
ncbi:MAG TPA: sulfatase [Acidobacteriaceae bacterium]|jgi:arylsulfatase A-like enzyme|nr:sulfatase [Acidobacteriaceae bacterium]